MSDEMKSNRYRVFKHQGATEDGQNIWHEVGEISGEGKYGFRPDADDLGEKWDAGEYLYYDLDSAYPRIETMVIVAKTVYDEWIEEKEEVAI